MEERPHHEPPDEHDKAQARECRQHEIEKYGVKAAFARAEHRNHEKERRDHQILEQENRKNRSARAGTELLAVGEFWNDDGGGRQREGKAEDQGCRDGGFPGEGNSGKRKG